MCKLVSVSAIVDEIVEELLSRHRTRGTAGGGRTTGRVDLNDIAEVIDARAVTYDEVEDIISRLESEGLRVGEPLSGRDIGVIRSVIVTGHRLTEKLRRRPTVEEIAVDSGHPPHVVRRALEHGRAAAPLRALRH